jgi:hypothetical protein
MLHAGWAETLTDRIDTDRGGNEYLARTMNELGVEHAGIQL